VRFRVYVVIFTLLTLACGYKASPPGKPDWTPPRVKIISPEDGDTIYSDAEVVLSITDESSIKKLGLVIYNRILVQDSVEPLSLVVPVDSIRDTLVEIKVRAFDVWDNIGESLPIRVYRILPYEDQKNNGEGEGIKPE